VGQCFFRERVSRLRFAAGDNLTNLPYLGPRFKKWGAFRCRVIPDLSVIMSVIFAKV
jgi:glycerol-3-phosphate O-acyltransferase